MSGFWYGALLGFGAGVILVAAIGALIAMMFRHADTEDEQNMPIPDICLWDSDLKPLTGPLADALRGNAELAEELSRSDDLYEELHSATWNALRAPTEAKMRRLRKLVGLDS